MSLSVVKPNLSLEKVAGPSTSYSENDVVLNKAMGKAETTNIAVYAHEEGSYFINNSGNLAKATSNITIGDVLIAKPNDNYNYEITSVADELVSPGGGVVGSTNILLPKTVNEIKSYNTEGTWNDNTYTRNGLTFELLLNQDLEVEGVKVTGTASDECYFFLSDNNYATHAGYMLSGCPKGGTNSTYRLGQLLGHWEYGAGTIILSDYTGAIAIWISSSYSISSDGLVFYPKIIVPYAMVDREYMELISSLGTASTKDSTAVISSGGGDLPTAGAVYSYIDTMITQALTASY